MTGRRVGPATIALLVAVLAGGIIGGTACTEDEDKAAEPTAIAEVSDEAATQAVLPLSAVLDAIEDGRIDIGEGYGLTSSQRYHGIHAQALSLGCSVCHTTTMTTEVAIFSSQDVSPQAPGPVDRRACIGCHRAGPGHNVYGSGSP